MKNLFLKNPFIRNAGIPLLFLLFQFPFASNAQYNIKENNVWAFGYHTGLDFSSGNPVPTAPLALPTNNVGSASVCDSSGKLLFYTNGHEIWDKNNQVMPNGDNIFPVVGRLSPYSASQGALIVPVLNNPDQYYVFSAEASSNSANDPAVCRLWYSIVDMTLNNGLGDVVSGKKSILIDSALSGNLLAVRGTECNIWVLTHAIDQTVFKAYNVTATGIDLQPVLSTVGTLPGTAYKWARMCFSPDGKKLAINSTGNGGGITGAGIELYDFDAATGKVSNAMYIDHVGGGGVAFSPDNSKLYITGIDATTYERNLFQYDVTQSTATAIQSSRQIITKKAQWIGLGLAPNGKIYHIASTGNERLAVINKPNLSGAACDYEDSVLISPGPPWSYMFGQEFSNVYVKAEPTDTVLAKAVDTLVCPDFGNLTLHAVSGAKAYLWDNGSQDSVRTITEAGTYYVRSAVDFCTNRVDTFVVGTYDVIDAVIAVDSFTLRTATPYATYQWMLNGNVIAGATDSTYTVTENGIYTVAVTTENGCRDTSAPYEVRNVTGINDLKDVAPQIKVYPNPAEDMVYLTTPLPVKVTVTGIEGKEIKTVTGVSSFSVKDLSAGLYLLRITDRKDNLIKVVKLVKKR